MNCATCDGHGQISCYIQLSITWKINTAEHIIERLDLPSDLIRDVSGQVAYEEEAPRYLEDSRLLLFSKGPSIYYVSKGLAGWV